MEHWKEALRRVFGSKSRKKWRNVAIDIMLVDNGIKRAYLFDQWASSKVEMKYLIESLYEHQLLNNELGILTVDLDFLIYSPQSFKHSIYIEPKIINVSLSLSKPALIKENESKIFYETYPEFIEFKHLFKRKQNSEISSINLDLNHEIKVSDSMNPPCLFGLVLGYPYVYWYDRQKGDDNCLSMQPLHLFQVKGLGLASSHSDSNATACPLSQEVHGNHPQTDSSKFENVSHNSNIHFYGGMEDNNQSAQCSYQTGPSHVDSSGHFNDSHVIFSFTVPENIFSAAIKVDIDNWFAKWKSQVQWSSLFSCVWMEEELRTPQAICL